MSRKKGISEKEISNEFDILSQTRDFLTSLRNKKNSELNFCLKELEKDFTDDMQQRVERVYGEIQNIEKKIAWETKRCNEFDQKVSQWKKQEKLEFVSQLSKKILNKDR